MEFKVVQVKKPEDVNLILGQSHFVKTAEDLYEAIISSAPGVKFGLAFSEASGHRHLRLEGNDDDMVKLAQENLMEISCGHTFIIFMRNAFPINVMGAVKSVPEVCQIFCATANQLQVVIAETEQGRGIMGVIDGEPPLGVETEETKAWRKDFLRKIGYKL